MGTGRHTRRRVDYVLLLHLEGCQMDRQGEARARSKNTYLRPLHSVESSNVYNAGCDLGCLFHGAISVRIAGGAARERFDAARRFGGSEVLRHAESLETRRSRGKTVVNVMPISR